MYGRAARKKVYGKYRRSSAVTRSARYHSRVPRRSRGYLGPYSGLKYTVGKVLQTKVLDNTVTTIGTGMPGDQQIVNTGFIVSFNGIGGAGQPGVLGIAQGTAYNNRIGNNIRVVAIRGRITVKIITETIADQVRMIVYEDKQANGTAATWSQIMQLNTNMMSYQNWFYVDRFKILKDEICDLNPPTSVVADQASITFYKTFEFSLKMSKPVRYSSTTGAIAELQSINIGVGFNSVNESATIQTTNSWVRTYFKDEQ